jgi:4-amino-4-deoxy-L-arabinose transferase-like glycosyltransferase
MLYLSPRAARGLLIAGAAVLLLGRLGAADFSASDEPRYGQIADELHSGVHGAKGWILLHLGGEPYSQKPPLYYWLATLAATGQERVSELAARLPSALAGIGLVWMVLRFGSRWLGAGVGLLGASFLLTMHEFATRARRVHLDVLLALFETGALAAFWCFERGVGPRRLHLALFHLCLGLGVLTKGPVGFVVPVLIVVAYRVWEGRWRDLHRLFPPWALALSVAPGLAWLASAVALAPAGFLRDALVENLVGRFFAGTSHARPFYYYFYHFPIDLLPWSLLAPLLYTAARCRARVGAAPRESSALRRFLVAWVAIPFLFFTVSAGKRGLYLLPAYPAVALLLADALCGVLEDRRTLPKGLTLTAVAVASAVAVAALRLVVWPPAGDHTAMRAMGIGALVVLAAGVLLWKYLGSGSGVWEKRVGVLVVAVFGVELLVQQVFFPGLNAERSPRPIAEAAASLTRADEPVGLFGNRAMLGGLIYYGRRRIVAMNTPESFTAFFSEGGRVIVVREKKLDRITAFTRVEERFRARSGSRTVLVVTARDDGPG